MPEVPGVAKNRDNRTTRVSLSETSLPAGICYNDDGDGEDGDDDDGQDDESDLHDDIDTGDYGEDGNEGDEYKSRSPTAYASLALNLMSQEWLELGMGNDPQVAVTSATTLDELINRVTALLTVRLVAWLQPRGTYPDLSTTTICRQILVLAGGGSGFDDDDDDDDTNSTHCTWPAQLTPRVLIQLRAYVWEILSGYHDVVPYHNVQHAYHVIVSTSKLLDMILLPKDENGKIDENENNEMDPCTAATPSHANKGGDNYYDYAQAFNMPIGSSHNNHDNIDPRRPPTFGLRDDPLMQLSLIFAALIHDVEHQGIPNRQLAIENDVLALQYNDTSIAENESLRVGFLLLVTGMGKVQHNFEELRKIMFPVPDDYRRFRKAVINLVLTTDIASPERTQIGKSKWKEAFGDPYETVERKVLKHMERRLSKTNTSSVIASPAPNIPLPPSSTHAPLQRKLARRLSTHSIMSELTLESRVPDPSNLAPSDSLSLHAGLSSELEDDESGSDTPESSDSEEAEEYPRPQYVPLSTSKEPEPSRMRIVRSNSGIKHGSARLDDYLRSRSRSPANNSVPGPMRRRKDGGGGTGGSTQTHHRTLRTHSMDVSLHSTGVMSCLAPTASSMAAKFHRRLSSIGGNTTGRAASRFRNQRLGLLRTVDLTGESIETYTTVSFFRQSATGATTSTASTVRHRSFDTAEGFVTSSSGIPPPPPEEIDELRESVVMETLLKAADVAHNLQGWDVMVKFSNRLFLELRKAHVQGRGDNPQNGWFTNQIGFLEAYLLPLARKLDDTGVFGDALGATFAQNVEHNRERWTREGMQLTARIIIEGERQYPDDDETTDECTSRNGE